MPFKSSEDKIAEWEEKHGEIIPIEGMDKQATVKRIEEFYKEMKTASTTERTNIF